MMVSPRLLLVACTFALSVPSVASAGLFGCHSDASCAAPCGDVCCEPTCAAPTYCCEPTCAAPCGDVCAPSCGAPVCGDVCADACGGGYYCQPQESCCKRFFRKLWDLEQRKNAWLLSKLPCHRDECAPAYYGCGECAPTCAAPCGDVCCEPTCAAPVYCAEPTCAAPCGCGH